MNTNRLALASISGFVFTFLYEWVFHGMLLQDAYKATANLWRHPEQMENFFPYTIAYQVIFVIFAAFLFTRNYEVKGIGEGLRFGLFLGLFMGMIMSSFYFYMPIDKTLALSWLTGAVIEGMGLGVIFSLTYRN